MDDHNDCACCCDSDPAEVWHDRLTMLQIARASIGSDDEADMAIEVIEGLNLDEAQSLIAVSAQLLMAAWLSMFDGDGDEADLFMNDLAKVFSNGST
jgi:hypothetical protein